MFGMSHRLLGRLAHVEHASRKLTRTPRQADCQRGAGQRVVQRRHALRRFKDVSAARRERDGVAIGQVSRCDEREPRQPHRVHRAGGRADVARMARPHEHDPNARQAIGGRRQ